MYSKNRKGITAVIAILLLLMMTVAAAGGAYVWMQSLQSQFQERCEAITNRDVQIKDLRCLNRDSDGVGVVKVFFKNSGESALDLDPVDMDVNEFATGNLNATLTRTSISLSSDLGTSERITITNGGDDFSEPGTSAPYEILLDDNLSVGDQYQVDFIFTEEEGLERGQPCEAGQR